MNKRIVLLFAALSLCLGSVARAQSGPTVHYTKPDESGRKDLPGKPLTQQQQDEAKKAYAAAPGKYCPKQRLTLQSPTQMNMQVQSFERQISPMQTARYRQFVSEACELTKPTADCANTAMLAAAQEGKYLDRFVVAECETGTRCTAAGKCSVR